MTGRKRYLIFLGIIATCTLLCTYEGASFRDRVLDCEIRLSEVAGIYGLSPAATLRRAREVAALSAEHADEILRMAAAQISRFKEATLVLHASGRCQCKGWPEPTVETAGDWYVTRAGMGCELTLEGPGVNETGFTWEGGIGFPDLWLEDLGGEHLELLFDRRR